MARKLSRSAQQRIKKNLGLLEEIALLADSVTEDSITDLVRRDAIGIGHDGMPSNSMPEYSSGGGFGGSSTETAALRGLPGEGRGEKPAAQDDWDRRNQKAQQADVLREQLKKIERLLFVARNAMKDIAVEFEKIDTRTERVRARVESAPCEICLVLPAAKAGWCPKDYTAWEQDGKPDRVRYAMWRRGDVNSEKEVLVPIKPPPTVKDLT